MDTLIASSEDTRPGAAPEGGGYEDRDLLRIACVPMGALLHQVGSGEGGLSGTEAERRLRDSGPNVAATEREWTAWAELAGSMSTPLNALLFTLAIASWALGDRRAAVVISVMILLSVLLSFLQEHRANRAAQALRAMVRTHAPVRRDGAAQDVPLEAVVPGDVVELSAGDLLPGDVRLLHAKDLHVNQAALTGEAMAAEKSEHPAPACVSLFACPNLC